MQVSFVVETLAPGATDSIWEAWDQLITYD